jgi:CTP synthase
LFTNVQADCVFSAEDVSCIYEVPIRFHAEGVDDKIAEALNIWTRAPELTGWERVVQRLTHPQREVSIALVGKYVELKESYKSLNEALIHGGIGNDCRVNLHHIDAEEIEKGSAQALLDGMDGILVAPGFGSRGTEGKIEAVRYARERSVPFFGICLGMQIAVIEFARSVVGLKKANSTEFDAKSPDPVIHLMKSQEGVEAKGGTMRLGLYPCKLTPGSKSRAAYGADQVAERHRHRFEFNNDYRASFEAAGARIGGIWPEGDLVEIFEIVDHPWFVGVQYHPEFKSKPTAAHPLFREFVKAAMEFRRPTLPVVDLTGKATAKTQPTAV